MAENEKLKILYLMDILLEETDKDHILNAVELCGLLDSRYGVSCNRKTIYNDIERLKTYGLDIVQVKGNTQGYYVSKRDFDLAELKLLVDAVQASKFITGAKSMDLIKKLQKLTNKENGKKLQRQVFIYNRPKTDNETIFASVDGIHEALQTNRQISFKYCEWTVKKEFKQKKNGASYLVSPWALTWNTENYYLVAYDEAENKIKHYRVDKMQEMEVTDRARLGKELFEGFDLADFAKKTFGMYGGHEETVTLLCRNSLAGVIIDRFGKDTPIMPVDSEHFKALVHVVVSPQFFGWVTGIGSGLQIAGSPKVKKEYLDFLQGVLNNYQE